jgi:hypothetical protein
MFLLSLYIWIRQQQAANAQVHRAGAAALMITEATAAPAPVQPLVGWRPERSHDRRLLEEQGQRPRRERSRGAGRTRLVGTTDPRWRGAQETSCW